MQSIADQLSSNGSVKAQFWSNFKGTKDFKSPIVPNLSLPTKLRVLSFFFSLWPSGREREERRENNPVLKKCMRLMQEIGPNFKRSRRRDIMGKKKQRQLCLWKFCGVLFLERLLFASRPPTSDGENGAPRGQHVEISYHRVAI